MTATTVPAPTIDRRARIGALGGALWTLFPLAFGLVHLEETAFGTPEFFAVAASYWLLGVLPPVLLVVGHRALENALGPAAGKAGRVGLALAAVGLGAMAIGNGIEVGSMTVGGGEVAAGHAVFLLGFLVSVVAGVLLGVVVVRRRDDGLARAAGLVLALALPLGIGIAVLGSSLGSQNDGWFFAAITVPTGLAWLLLGTALRSGRRPATELAPAS
jgi:hypothetical protein